MQERTQTRAPACTFTHAHANLRPCPRLLTHSHASSTRTRASLGQAIVAVGVADEAETLGLEGAELRQHYSAVGRAAGGPQFARQVRELVVGRRAVHAADFAALHAVLDRFGAMRVALENEHVAHVSLAHVAHAPVPLCVHGLLHAPRHLARGFRDARSDFEASDHVEVALDVVVVY